MKYTFIRKPRYWNGKELAPEPEISTSIELREQVRFSHMTPSTMRAWNAAKGKYVYLTELSRRNELWDHSNIAVAYSNTQRDANGAITWMREDVTSLVPTIYVQIDELESKAFDGLKSMSEIMTAAYAEANEHDFDIGTFFGELPETIRFGADLLSRAFKILSEARRTLKGKPPKKKRSEKDLNQRIDDAAGLAGSGWLAYRYAIMPLMYSAADLLKSMEPPEYVFERIRHRDSAERQPSDTKVFHSADFRVETSSDFKIVRRAQIYQILLPEHDAKRRRLLNASVTMYELMTLSFVLDWFVSFGDLLMSLQNIETASRGATFSERIQMRTTSFSAHSGTDSVPRRTMKWPTVTRVNHSVDSYSRIVDPDFTKTPPLNRSLRLAICRQLDAVALIHAFDKKRW